MNRIGQEEIQRRKTVSDNNDEAYGLTIPEVKGDKKRNSDCCSLVRNKLASMDINKLKLDDKAAYFDELEKEF